MEPLRLAIQYMEIFFGSSPIDSLAEILSEDCSFKGPFYEFDSAKAYIESLKSDPPVNVSYQVVDSFENEESACLIYEFYKPGFSTVMSQAFKVTDGKIASILLIFDTAAFKK